MSLRHSLRRLLMSSVTLSLVGGFSLALVVPLLMMHVREISTMQESALPLLATLPSLERRLSILKEQVEVTQLDTALRTGSDEERVRVYVLPTQTALDRALATFDALRNDLTDRGVLTAMSSIRVGERFTRSDGLRAIPLTVQFTVRGEGARYVFAFLRMAGLLSIGDVLTRSEKQTLIRATEEENPAAIVALEQFFSTDLLSYAKEPRPVDEQLKRSLSSESFTATLQTILSRSLLNDARELLRGEFGRSLDRYRLWPVQMLQIANAEVQPGSAPDWYRLDFTVLLLERAS